MTLRACRGYLPQAGRLHSCPTMAHNPHTQPLMHTRLWARWLLALMLLATLAPTVSRAMAVERGASGWVELCTSTGTRWVQMDNDAAPTNGASTQGDSHVLDACGYCVLASERFAPLLPSLPAVLAHAPTWAVPAFVATVPPLPDVPRHAARDPPL